MADGGVKIALKVIPNAPRDEVVGWRGEALTVKVAAPAREGRANRQLHEFLAEVFGVSPVDLTLLQGANSRRKVIHVAHLSAAEARECLKPHLD